ncbi:hypothetical protein TRFO_32220 [Tritrichomonas foetus]|uniref:N-acetylgalactosaminide beta-1,3-galactosyltransferase n=1 Tax=Tritrichomonas foetus TaxID=1144522 RepID=A0A1J4JQD1_9EUKA|nr:hypothetical protein TRFO_32220 [Tritrichomonas foetus]|eukprot:OHT00954.1 hypothetical protein TRFO_32220 [Tritrichomonas foetus]
MKRNRRNIVPRNFNIFVTFGMIILLLLHHLQPKFLDMTPKVLQSSSQFRPLTVESIDNRNSLFVLALTSQYSYKKRVNVTANGWGKKFKASPHFGGLYYSSVPGYNGSIFNNIEITQKFQEYQDSMPFTYHERASVDLSLRTVVGFHYFIKNSNASWIARIVDDTFVNVDKLPVMMDYINSNYDPNKDPVVQGHCIDYHPFLHGGSGFLFSRRAAEYFMADGFEWYRQLNLPEDVHFNLYVQKIGLTLDHASSRFHVGYSFNKEQLDQVVNHNLSNIQYCALQNYHHPHYCHHFYGRLNEIVFVHDHMHLLPLDKLEFYFTEPDDNVYWYSNLGFARICKVDENHPANVKLSPYNTDHSKVSAIVVQKFVNIHRGRWQKILEKEWNSLITNKTEQHFKEKIDITSNQLTKEQKQYIEKLKEKYPKPDYYIDERDRNIIDKPINYEKGEFWDYRVVPL